MPIDPNEAPPGYKAVGEVEIVSCEGCVFNTISIAGCATDYPCDASDRTDGCEVIFVKENDDAN